MSSKEEKEKKPPCEEGRSLPADTHSLGIVNYIEEDGSMWVMLNTDVNALSMISKELNSIVPSSESVNISVNKVFAVLHSDSAWYRARVLTVTPEITIQFIDFGDKSIVTVEQITLLPQSMSDVPPLAMKVALSPGSTYIPNIGQNIQMKPLSKNEDLTIVDVVFASECQMNDGDVAVDITSGIPDDSEKLSSEDETEVSRLHDPTHPSESEPVDSSSSDVTAYKEASNLIEDGAKGLGSPGNGQVGALNPIYSDNESSDGKVPIESLLSITVPNIENDDKKPKGLSETAYNCLNLVKSHLFTSAGNQVDADTNPPEDCAEVNQSSDSNSEICGRNDNSKVAKTVLDSVCDSSGGQTRTVGQLEKDAADNELNVEIQGNQEEQRESSQHDPFISALGRYPHLGGGYGIAASIEASVEKNFKEKDSRFQNPHAAKGLNQVISQSSKTYNYQGSKSVRPPNRSNSFHSNYSKNSQIGGPSQTAHQISSDSRDFKSLLNLELSIIREQNRLQLLQIQKKMDEQYSTLAKQVNSLRDDMTQQLSIFRNEVNSKLLLMNDALVQKVALFYTDLDSLKNDLEIKSGKSKEDSKLELSPLKKAVKGSSIEQQKQSQHQTPPGDSEKVSTIATDNKQWNQSPSQDNIPPNRLMKIRKEKMVEREQAKDSQPQQSFHHNQQSNTQHNEKNASHQHSVSEYPKMDHFDLSKISQQDTKASNKNGCIVFVGNLDAENITPDLIFTLFGVYGNVQRVKISLQDKGKAYVEMAEPAHAEAVIRYLDGIPFMGRNLRVSSCVFNQLKIYKQDLQSNTSKDYSTKSALQRLHRFKSGNWNPQKLYPPSDTLLISNILKSVSEDKIKEVFAKHGHNIQSLRLQSAFDDKQMAFATFSSVEEAVNALPVMHLKELSDWVHMRLSFGRGEKKYIEN